MLLLQGTGCGTPAPPEPPPDEPGDGGITGKYIGSTRCQLCHALVHDNWAQTLHAEALVTLEEIGQDQNPDCLPCHTVGYGDEGGFVNRTTTNDLGSVGCEACHGPARAHTENVNDPAFFPPVDLSSEVCGACHTGSRYPTYEQWAESRHAHVTPSLVTRFQDGASLNSCGACHSGDYYYLAVLMNETVSDDLLAGVPEEGMSAVECAICHDPHMRTGNAASPDGDRDYQLRFPEVANPIPTNTIEAVQDTSRFNLCGQCHHSRGRTWADSDRGPHHSLQNNVYHGEMPVPEGTGPLVISRVSVHSFAPEQCSTCHMYQQDFQDELAPPITDHTFGVNHLGCAAVGCHPSTDQAMAAQATLQTEMQARLDEIAARLGDPATWEYTSNGGPDAAGQEQLADEIKQARFLYYYALEDRSLGVHNPDYVRNCLITASALLASVGL
jgi:formate-dependent nitrite reductase cytochrome c552 subunit